MHFLLYYLYRYTYDPRPFSGVRVLTTDDPLLILWTVLQPTLKIVLPIIVHVRWCGTGGGCGGRFVVLGSSSDILMIVWRPW